jgi:hypothetical protein
MLDVALQVTPPDRDVELALSVKTQPILVTFSRHLTDRLTTFFAPPGAGGQNDLIEQLILASNASLEAVQKQVRCP